MRLGHRRVGCDLLNCVLAHDEPGEHALRYLNTAKEDGALAGHNKLPCIDCYFDVCVAGVLA